MLFRSSSGDGDADCGGLDDVDDSPIFLAYPYSEEQLTTNVTILSRSPIVLGGDVRDWQISPSLPSGLSFNNATGGWLTRGDGKRSRAHVTTRSRRAV